MATFVHYICPICRNDPHDDGVPVIHYGKRKQKEGGGRFSVSYVGICRGCGVLYVYNVEHSSIFEEKE